MSIHTSVWIDLEELAATLAILNSSECCNIFDIFTNLLIRMVL